jgi:hypothetical protein
MNYHTDSTHLHFHIRWENRERLDWECFNTYYEAEARGMELAAPDETFTVEELSDDCPIRRVALVKTYDKAAMSHRSQEAGPGKRS